MRSSQIKPRIFTATVATTLQRNNTRVHASNAHPEDAAVRYYRRGVAVSRFIPGIIFMYAATGHARRSAIGDMFVGHDLLPTSATVNLIVTFTPPAVRRASGGECRLHGCQGVASLKCGNRHEIYIWTEYVYLRFTCKISVIYDFFLHLSENPDTICNQILSIAKYLHREIVKVV